MVGALVLVLDGQGRITRFNSACERLSGYDCAEVVGRAVWDVVIPPNQVDDVRTTFASLQAGAFPNARENHWLTRTGEQRLVSWQNTCLTDDQGAVAHVIATGIDITDARRGDGALHGIEVVGRLLAEQGPVPSALDAVLGELETRMGYRYVSLYLADEHGLRLGAQRGYRATPERLAAGAGVIGRVYRTGHSELVGDVSGDPDYVSGEDGVVTEIAAPLLGDGSTIGVLNIEEVRLDALTPDDLRLAVAIADRLSSALRRNQAQEALRERVRLFAALAEFAVAVNAIREPERLAASARRRRRRRRPIGHGGGNAPGSERRPLPCPCGSRIGRGGHRRDHRARRRDGRSRHQRAHDRLHGHSSAGRVLLDVERLPSVRIAAVGRGAAHQRGPVLGVISVGRAGSGATFSEAEREVFTLLGSHAALALANAHLVEEVSALAIHDGLTGLYNRRHFDAELGRAIARFKRRAPAGNLGAIMFDLDHFGEFNRRHGHLAGDAVLRLFAGILHERLRSGDIVARYGGEEFVAILEDCALPEVMRVADEVRAGLAARSVPGIDGQPLSATVSAGCAVIDPAMPTQEALLGQADAGLFAAKRAGRNRVVSA